MWSLLLALSLTRPAPDPVVHVARREYPQLEVARLADVSGVPRSAREIGAQIDAWLDEGASGNMGDPPHDVWNALAYDDAARRLQSCYRDAGFLSARVGPIDAVTRANTATVRIPIVLGPRATLYDVAFRGVRSFSERALNAAAVVTLGEPVQLRELDEARRRVERAYRDEGFVFARIDAGLDLSEDGTRGRVVFDIDEGPRVVVERVEVRGLRHTLADVVLRRSALEPGSFYRREDARRTRDEVAALGPFEHVDVALADPDVRAERKVVLITVTELPRHFVDVMPGFGLGEGFRGEILYRYPSLFDRAIGADVRLRASYLPLGLVANDSTRSALRELYARGWDRALAGGAFVSLTLPETGPGPRTTGQIGAALDRRLTSDFVVDKRSGFVSATHVPSRGVSLTAGPGVEHADTALFAASSIDRLASDLASRGELNSDVERLLRVPAGASWAITQRATFTWDRRDDALDAHKGTYFTSSVEHVTWYAVDPAADAPRGGDFVRLTQTFAGWAPLLPWLTLASELRLGANLGLEGGTATYPDRLFFLGGTDSMRAWHKDAIVPQDVADRFGANPPLSARGGNLMVNPRAELRVPMPWLGEGLVFGDVGNVWRDPTYALERPPTLRAALGPGLRVPTPIGPVFGGYGFNVTRRSYEDLGAWNLAIGVL